MHPHQGSRGGPGRWLMQRVWIRLIYGHAMWEESFYTKSTGAPRLAVQVTCPGHSWCHPGRSSRYLPTLPQGALVAYLSLPVLCEKPGTRKTTKRWLPSGCLSMAPSGFPRTSSGSHLQTLQVWPRQFRHHCALTMLFVLSTPRRCC